MNREPRPIATRGRSVLRWVAAALAVAVIVGVGFGLWYLFLRPAGPAAVADASLPPVPSAAAGATAKPLGSGGVDGTWNVDTSIGTFTGVKDTSGNFVGYRVQEQLAGIGANTAVGRTPKVSGSLAIARTKVTAVTITADLTALQSDDPGRDGRLRDQGIQWDQFPTATFKLTSPIDLGSIPADGKQIDVTASGQLTLHGVTKDVQIALKAKLSGSVIVVTGSLPIAFADYSIVEPESFKVLSIEDSGTMELQLFFSHA
jgi:polyisoprenoid-binding protein YceI